MNIETVRNQCKALRLHTAATELEEVVSEHKKAVSLTWISDLLEREIDARREKALMLSSLPTSSRRGSCWS